jgi:PKD repeat protein
MVGPNSTLRTVALLVAALVMCSCGDVTVPSLTTPTPTPARGTPAHLEVTVVPGIGPTGGVVAVSARVQDVTGATLPNVSIAFTTSAGSFSATPVTTDDQGIARTTLAAPAGTAQVRAAAGSITSPMVTVSVQPQTAPPPAPTCPPGCDPPPPTPGPSGPLSVRMSASAATLGTSTVFAAAVEGAGGQNFAWDFGDGARVDGFSPTSAHTYAALGSYQATVIVRDTFGRVGSAGAIAVVSAVPPTVPPPTPAPVPPTPPRYEVTLSASASPIVGAPVTLTAKVNQQFSAPAPTSIVFTCGGGATPTSNVQTTATTTTTTCTYTTAGLVTANVTATNGTLSGTASTNVTVAPPPPPTITIACNSDGKIGAPAVPTTCHVQGVTINGIAASVTTVTKVDWDWGDGNQNLAVAGSTSPAHTYSSASTFTVFGTATITGASTTATAAVNVTIVP